MKETSLPSKGRFYSKLKLSTISDDDYKFACDVFRETNCESIEAYKILYLITDVFLLAEVFEYFCRTIFENYKLDPAKAVTIFSTAMQTTLLQLNLEIYVIREINFLKDFENNVRGGLVNVVRAKKTSNNE